MNDRLNWGGNHDPYCTEENCPCHLRSGRSPRAEKGKLWGTVSLNGKVFALRKEPQTANGRSYRGKQVTGRMQSSTNGERRETSKKITGRPLLSFGVLKKLRYEKSGKVRGLKDKLGK